MKYKTRRGQIFGKRLEVPYYIRNKVYDCKLTFLEYIKYHLDEKDVPIKCIRREDRELVERFGIEKCKTLDWELIDSKIPVISDVMPREYYLTVSPLESDINKIAYESLIPVMKPSDYSKMMMETYPERVFEVSLDEDDEIKHIKYLFNDGILDLRRIVLNWDLLKDKDLSYCLLNDSKNKNKITDSMIKEFMSSYSSLVRVLIYRGYDIYKVINDVMSSSIEDRNRNIKKIIDELLNESLRNITLTNDEYRELFKYSSMDDYFAMIQSQSNIYRIEELTHFLDAIHSLGEDYIYNMPFPISELTNKDVLDFIIIFGIKNIVDFDNECGHFFSKDDNKILRMMFEMYIHYGSNTRSLDRTIYTKGLLNGIDNPPKNRYTYEPYTKEEFYEAVRRMLVYGPTNGKFKPIDYRDISGEFRERNQNMFISDEARDDLKDLYYTKSLTLEYFDKHKDQLEYIRDKNLLVCFPNNSVMVEENARIRYREIYQYICDKYGFDAGMDFLFEYREFIETLAEFSSFTINANDDLDDVRRKFNDNFIERFNRGGVPYPKIIPKSLKERYKEYFLPDNTPDDVKAKFYGKALAIEDFNNDPNFINYFNETNIVCGFPSNYSWIIKLFSYLSDTKLANYNRLKVIIAYSKIQDKQLEEEFKYYIKDNIYNMDIKKVDFLAELLRRLSLSNSSEIYSLRTELCTQLLNIDNPNEALDKIEEIFLKNNIPTVGKVYSCFEILFPDIDSHVNSFKMVSPVLSKSSTTSRKVIIFSDLIRAAFGSNNRSINDYLDNIYKGSLLYEKVKDNNIEYDSLTDSEKDTLSLFSKYLITLYNSSLKAKRANDEYKSSGDILTDIIEIAKKISPDGTLNYSIGDRIIKMFCGFSGIDTLEQARTYVKNRVARANKRNILASRSKITLNKGDLVKGISSDKYLSTILQNGSVAKEYLGSHATSDSTPLDTDVAIITTDGPISNQIESSSARNYGPIWLVLKNDDRFMTTRTDEENIDFKRDLSKLELFYTGVVDHVSHYGIRTGFASTEIDYILTKDYNPKIGLEIALNGFYIPVIDFNENLVFSYEDYLELRKKMIGLSYYHEDTYIFSDNLYNPETEMLAREIEENNYNTNIKRMKINEIIRKSVEELGLKLKTKIDGDLTPGSVELIDTGSTGRETNKIGEGDFDLMMRLDRKLLNDKKALSEFKNILLRNFNSGTGIIGSGDFRLKGVELDDTTTVDIDITFIPKTDKVTYSTDMALVDRLETIKQNDPEKYKYVVANILLAKKVLKEAEVYKPNRGDNPQGGLGGVGIENWVLQNGGSFIDAINSFLKASQNKTFNEFIKEYYIWDFGDNHLAERNGLYPHDNFVDNMTEKGYQKMIKVLKEYLVSVKTSESIK